MSAVVIWRPERLNAKLLAAQIPARAEWAGIARGRCSSRRVAASIVVAGDRVIAGHPLAPILEEGARPHAIELKDKKAFKLADGSFVSGSIQHPGSPAKPFLKPTLPMWPPLYRRAAMGAFRGL